MSAVQYVACLIGLVFIAAVVLIEIAECIEDIRWSGRRWR